ncbi:uncharacterized protein METZ01_LOCUS441592, partial [marine metagenome]
MSNKGAKNRTVFAGVALVLGVLLLISVNLLGNAAFRNLRVDLTEDRLFTLSDGTHGLLGSLGEPLLLRLYYNHSLANDYPTIRDYARRVRNVLAEYVAASNGMITFEVMNPEP